MIAEPKGHVVDIGLGDVSITGQAKLMHYVGQCVIPGQDGIIIYPIQGHAICVFRAIQDTLSLCAGQHWPNPLCKTAHSL